VKTSRLRVRSHADGHDRVLGELTYDARQVRAAWQWSDEALGLGLNWSPVHLPVSPDLWQSGIQERDLLGLPGLIHDALPDGWGLLLMDRAFAKAGLAPTDITPLVRLSFLADRCWGALSFEPVWQGDVPRASRVAVDTLAQEAARVMSGATDEVSRELLVAGGSPHGARPKVAVGLSPDGRHALVGDEALPEGYRPVIMKFAGDGETPSHPIFEACYLDAARTVGVRTMPSQLMSVAGQPALCVDRFDRQHGQRQHVHSLAGLLHVTHRVNQTDWLAVNRLLDLLPGAQGHREEALFRAVFNAVFCVRDDHTKNQSFLMQPSGAWSLSPAYDLSFCTGPGGYHAMMYAGHQGQHVTHADLVRLAHGFGLSDAPLDAWLAQLRTTRATMMEEARGLGVQRFLLTQARQQFRAIDQALRPRKTARGQG